MKMLGHQNPADEQEKQFLSHLLEPLDKAAPKTIREEKGRAAVGAGRDELEFTGTVYAMIEGHGAEEYTLDGAGPEENAPSGDRRHQKKGVCASPRVVRFAFAHSKIARAEAIADPARLGQLDVTILED